MPWIIVLGDEAAIDWVIENQRMAVNPRVKALPDEGDRIVLYTSRGAYHRPNTDEAQVRGVGTVTGPVSYAEITIGETTYAKSFPVAFDHVAERRQGLPFLPLVADMEFITKKDKLSWGGALRRPLVRIPDSDFARIDKAFRRRHKSAATSSTRRKP